MYLEMNLTFLYNLVSIWIWLMSSAFHPCVFSLFFFSFFFFPVTTFDYFLVNSAHVHCSRVPQTSLFSHFFIKNWSHSTIYTFKNYFVTVFSVFSKNKLYPNESLVCQLEYNFLFVKLLLKCLTLKINLNHQYFNIHHVWEKIQV